MKYLDSKIKGFLKFRYMKKAVFVLSLFALASSFTFLDIAQQRYAHEYRSGKFLLFYSYVSRNDSIFMGGFLREKRSENPILGVNVTIENSRIGTVSELPGGKFEIFLPRKQGKILFQDPSSYKGFEFSYKFIEDVLKTPFSHQ